MSDILPAARRYIPRALLLEGKRPLLPAWPTVTATVELVEEWWARYPDANVGIRTGGGLAVLDIIPRHGGTDALADLEALYGPLPATPAGRDRRRRPAPLLPHHRDGRLLRHRARRRDEGRGPPSCRPAEPVPGHRTPVRLAARPALQPASNRCPSSGLRPAAAPARGGVPVRDQGDDPLRTIPATSYRARAHRPHPRPPRLCRCPLHGDGQERTPSLQAGGRDPALWHCFACGSIYDLAALLAGYALPLRGAAFLTVRAGLREHTSSIGRRRHERARARDRQPGRQARAGRGAGPRRPLRGPREREGRAAPRAPGDPRRRRRRRAGPLADHRAQPASLPPRQRRPAPGRARRRRPRRPAPPRRGAAALEPASRINTPARLDKDLTWQKLPIDPENYGYKTEHARQIVYVVRMLCGASQSASDQDETAAIVGVYLQGARRVEGHSTYRTGTGRYAAAMTLQRAIDDRGLPCTPPSYLLDADTGEYVIRVQDLGDVARRQLGSSVARGWLDARMLDLGWQRVRHDGHALPGRQRVGNPHARVDTYRGHLPASAADAETQP